MTGIPITSLDQLNTELSKGTGVDGYLGLMHRLHLTRNDVQSLVEFNDDHYRRKHFTINPDYEILVMSWQFGQSSPIHGYDHKEGWIYVIEGTLTIDYFFRSEGSPKMVYYGDKEVKAGQFVYVNDYIGFHRVKNMNESNAISVHIHATPVTKWEIYDPEKDEYIWKELVEG